jgi:hypothetical protein
MRTSFDLIAAFNLGFAFMLMTFNCGLKVYSENKIFAEYMEKKSDKGGHKEDSYI